MSSMLTRMLAYSTLVLYLVVGTVAVRFLFPKSQVVAINSQYLSAFQETKISDEMRMKVDSPEITFNEIKIPVERKIVEKIIVKKIQVVALKSKLKDISVGRNELPFQETISLSPIQFENPLIENHLAYYKEISEENVLLAGSSAVVEDKISTSLAASEEVEPEFFEYPAKENNKEAASEKVAEEVEQVKENVVDDTQSEMASAQTDNEFKNSEISSTVNPEEDLVAFDYSKAKQDIQTNIVPTVTGVTIQQSEVAGTVDLSTKTKPAQGSGVNTQPDPIVPEPKPSPAPPKKMLEEVQVTIQVTGNDLKNIEKLNDFRIRFQDDSSELGDLGTGEINLNEALSSDKTTRSILVLKSGFIPTNTDLILSNDFDSFSIPMIDEEAFNKEFASLEGNGPIGAVLVELDDSTELAQLDVDFDKVILLDGDMKVTEKDDFRYQLFLGVNAGNATISYKGVSKQLLTKTIHVHERELTFDSNFYEEVLTDKVKVFEEDLMAKEKSPMITSGDSIKILNTNSTALKVSNNGYKLNFGPGHLGGRRYLEFNHHATPMFVGMRNLSSVTLPSESLRNYIEQYKTAGSCLVQVNVKKKILNVDIDSESVERSLMTTMQMLDTDGKFYDSPSEKTRKIIIVGETQANGNINKEAKINLKVEYTDGLKDYLNTFCIPGTYLVEQL